MKKFLAAVLLVLACAPARAARFERGPYLENMSRDMVTVRFRVDADSPAWLSYGQAPDCERFLTPVAAVREHKVQLFGLLPDTTHCYRIYLPADQSTGVYKAFEGNFTTFRDETKPFFSFLAFGDSGSGSEEQLELAAQMEKFLPDFVMHTGDVLSDGLDADADDQYYKPYANLLSRAPFFLALGNHDYGRDLKTAAGKGFLKANFTPFHSVPLTGLPPHYYFFDDANARFFVLDANGFTGAQFAPDLAPGSKQYKWLEHYLSKANDKTWKFVMIHQPLYSTGAHPPEEEVVKALEPLFLKYKVDLVLQGHDHDYERTLPVKEGLPDETGGIIYITLGGGGNQLYIQRRNEDWSAKFLPVYHFAVFSVNEKNLKMAVYNKAGEQVDTLEIQK
ncbi:MAG: metallophosphoesterase [Elusimicrobiales bacterium]|nr:metallophosphoesterase [Elusimicrobiales bacterium]